MNDLGNAFTFPFKDSSWVSKFFLGALFMILSIFLVGIFILAGYFVQVTQRVMRREPNPLPEWDDIGVKLVVGFKFCLVYLVYLLPMILLYIPFIAMTILGELTDSGDMTGIFTGVFGVGLMLLAIPYALFMVLLLPIITYRFAERESIADALDIAGIFRAFTRNWQDTLIVALIAAGIQSFAGVGIVFFFVGIFFTVMYSYLVSAYMFGSLYHENTRKGIAVS